MALSRNARKGVGESQNTNTKGDDQMSDRIGDTTLGIGHQSLGVLQYLANMAPDFATYKNGWYDVMITTRPWYNGREQGIVVSMSKSGFGTGGYIHVAVFEHRSGDNIVTLKWETEQNYYNSPNESETLFEDAYAGDIKNFDYGQVGECARYVYEALEASYTPSIVSETA